ncbi:MAG: hypothetical protein JWN29_1247 [Acidimicrobiales bacterium]|nr:hypothetical protein [Acidimicrobiales bacterium]
MTSTPRRRVAVLGSLLVVLAACGGSGAAGASCIRVESAEVCTESSGGAIRVRAAGLQPGSDLVLDTDGTGSASYSVGDDGQLSGEVGILTGDPSTPVDITVAATTGSGAVLKGQLRART